MDPNLLVEALVAKLDANDTWGAVLDFGTLRGNHAGLDDAHKIMLTDALLRPEWGSNPPKRPRPDLEPEPVT